MKYQETQKRCPANVVAYECRPSEKCGMLCFSTSTLLVANLNFLPQETVERHRRNTRLALSKDLAACLQTPVHLQVLSNKSRNKGLKVPARRIRGNFLDLCIRS